MSPNFHSSRMLAPKTKLMFRRHSQILTMARLLRNMKKAIERYFRDWLMVRRKNKLPTKPIPMKTARNTILGVLEIQPSLSWSTDMLLLFCIFEAKVVVVDVVDIACLYLYMTVWYTPIIRVSYSTYISYHKCRNLASTTHVVYLIYNFYLYIP